VQPAPCVLRDTMPRDRDRQVRVPVEEVVGWCGAVPAGDQGRAGAHRHQALGQDGPFLGVQAGERLRLRQVGRDDVASGNSRPISVATASGSNSLLPELATITGSTTRRQPAPRQLIGDGLDDGGGEEHAGLGGVGADVRRVPP